MTTFHDGDLSSALRRMARRSRDEAAVLLGEAERLDRAAAILDKQKYETVPLAAVHNALEMGAPVFADEVLTPISAAKTGVPKERRPSPAIQAKMRALLHEAGPLPATEFSARVGVSQVHFYLALRPLLASGEIVRDGPKNGPGVTYRLATTGKDGDAHEAGLDAGNSKHTTAPAEIPPAAPPPVARDRVRAPALTRDGKVRKIQPRTVADVVGPATSILADALAATPPQNVFKTGTAKFAPSIPGQIVLDILREAGAAGEKPSRLRIECGLEPTMFRKMMDALMEAGAVVREKDGTNAEQVRYRLKEFSAQLPLAKGGTAALDGRGHEEGAP